MQFHHFQKLPLELRQKIRGFATPPPWLITRKIAYTPTGFRDTHRYTRQVPAVLHTCKESREAFVFVEGVKKDHPTYTIVEGLGKIDYGAVFISMEHDILLIKGPSELFFPIIARGI
jgi:hypothetical protein